MKQVYKVLPLYEIWLAVEWAHRLSIDYVSDMETDLKDARKHRTKMKRLVTKAASDYEKVEGRLPDMKLNKKEIEK